MFGATESLSIQTLDYRAICIILISFIAMATDLWRGRIFNWLNLSGMIAGLSLGFILSGWDGLLQSFLGMLLGLALYGWIFWLGFMGGGDVKFLMALGSIGGAKYTAEVALLAILCGGGMSIVLLLVKGKLIIFLKKIYFFFLSIFVSQLEIQLPKIDHSVRMPFGVPISVAAVWTYFSHPLVKSGLVLWP